MTISERVRYYAKAVASIIGGLGTFTTVVIAVVDDNSIATEEWGLLITAFVTLTSTVTAVVKVSNVKPVGL